jgi:hypothetical protein
MSASRDRCWTSCPRPRAGGAATVRRLTAIQVLACVDGKTTVGFVKFSVSRPKTVGGPIEIAAITKHEGFKWIERRHFFPLEHNTSD